MSDPGFDPRLKAAMHEIQEVLQRYDIGAAIFLVSPTHSEYGYELPSWSVLRFEDPDEAGKVALRFRSKLEDFANRESQKAATEATVHLVEHVRLLCGQGFAMFDELMTLLEQHLDITRTPRRHRPGQPGDAELATRFRQPRRPGQGGRRP